MAITNTGMTLYTDNDTQQSWAGTDDLDSEVYEQGTGSESWLVGKNASETGTLTLSANMAAAKYFTFYMKSDWANFYDYIHSELQSSTNNFLSFTPATGKRLGGDSEISGDFHPSVLQLSEGVETGTYVPGSHTVLRVNVDASNSGNIRAIVNHWIDCMYHGTGRTIGGTTANDKLFLESHVADTTTNDTFDGCTELTNAGLAIYTDVEITATTGNSYGETVTWYAKPTTDGLFTLLITGTADLVNTVLIGNGCTIAVDTTGATAFGMSGGGITNGGNIDFASGQTIDGVVLTSCLAIDTNGANFSNITINTTTEVTTGALLINSVGELALMADVTFNSYTGKYAVYIPSTVTGTITLTGFVGDGSGTDVYWDGADGTTLTINKAGGTNFSTWATPGTATVSIVSSVDIDINVKDESGVNISGALVYVDEDLGAVGNIVNTTTDINGDVATSYSGAATSATVRVRKYGFKPFKTTVSLLANSATNVTLINDPQQN